MQHLTGMISAPVIVVALAAVVARYKGRLVGAVVLAGGLALTGGLVRLDSGGGQVAAGSGIPDAYLDLIVAAANDAGCPEVTPALLAAQLHQESGFNPRAKSSVGAMGIAQFMPGTWATHGSGDVWNPADAIPAAARYDCAVAAAVARVPGNRQELMLAGYNAGPGAVLEYAGIPPFPETRNYVQVITAKAATYAAGPLAVSGPTSGESS